MQFSFIDWLIDWLVDFKLHALSASYRLPPTVVLHLGQYSQIQQTAYRLIHNIYIYIGLYIIYFLIYIIKSPKRILGQIFLLLFCSFSHSFAVLKWDRNLMRMKIFPNLYRHLKFFIKMSSWLLSRMRHPSRWNNYIVVYHTHLFIFSSFRLENDVFDEDGNSLSDLAFDTDQIAIRSPVTDDVYTLYYPPEKRWF